MSEDFLPIFKNGDQLYHGAGVDSALVVEGNVDVGGEANTDRNRHIRNNCTLEDVALGLLRLDDLIIKIGVTNLSSSNFFILIDNCKFLILNLKLDLD
jgi:hypothetical protein